MTPCARSCCWSPFSCARNRSCACHWDDQRPASRNDGGTIYSDPTAQQAVRNVMNEGRRR